MWRLIKGIFKFAFRVVAAGFNYLITATVPAVGAPLFGSLVKHKDPTWDVLLKLGAWTVGAFCYYWAWEVYAGFCIWWGWHWGGAIWDVFGKAYDEAGFWKGTGLGLWRSIPLTVDPLLGTMYKEMVKAYFKERAPTSGSLRRFSYLVREPDHNPYPPEAARNAAKRPKKGKSKPTKADLEAWEGEDLPLFEDEYEVGRRYVVDYNIELHDAERAGPHWDFTFRDPHTGMVQRWAIPKQRWPSYEYQDGKWVAVQVQAFKSDGKHGHSEMLNPPLILDGYGKGTTKVVQKGKGIVWMSSHGNLHFTTNDGNSVSFNRMSKPGEYLLIPLKDGATNGIPIPYAPRSTEFVTMDYDPAKVEELFASGKIAYATVKGDGSYREMARKSDRVTLVGRRPEMKNGKPVVLPDGNLKGIDVSGKVPGARDLPKEVFPVGSKAEVEVYVRDRTIHKGHDPFMQVSRALNSSPGNSAELQATDGELIIKQWRLHNIGDHVFTDAFEMAAAMDALKRDSGGVIHTFPRRTTAKGTKLLWAKVVREDGEGIILVPRDLSEPMIRMKRQDSRDFKIIGVEPIRNPVENSKWFDADGNPTGTGVFVYETADGEIGRVGGLTDEQRIDSWEHPERYIGQVIEIEAHEFTPRGVARKPRDFRIREDKTC